MSSNSISNPTLSESKTSTVQDETSNQSVDIPDPSEILTSKQSSSSDSYETISDSDDSNDDDDDESDFPIDLTFDWLDEQMRAGVDLRPILSRLLPGLPDDISQSSIYEIFMDLFLPIRHRKPLEQYKTLDDAVELIHTRKNILILTGAGISVSCGIPDFRSRNGIYARLHKEFPELPNPQSMFDINYFTHDPRPFFRFAKEIWPGQYQPSLAHYFIAELERQDKLLRNYTQNIDSLEHLCSITRLIQCHGSFSTATCRNCHYTVQSDEIKNEILQQKIPYCPKCSKDNNNNNAILKPDIVFFGEQLPDDFHKTISIDKNKCDLLIVMGSSLKVKPVSLVSELLSADIPQILINREHLPHKKFDIELLGNCDVIINELCLRLTKINPLFRSLKNQHEYFLNEISYENLRQSIQQQQQKQKRKKQKISLDIDNHQSLEENLSSIHSKTLKSKISTISISYKQTLSSLKNSSLFNEDTSYISYPPRRYIFAGAEICFSSDEDDLDNLSDEEELPRKHTE
ncbi:unnamed protein product [Rotaria sp. Silwood1]|nr:unnamed protein product [Rotaria sp. Silwood1]CAF0839602.1 unnamed protein product [Rotaria sp. Silwood1]CAF3341033.1 unnamed protein product [Rotaria sp. Silwood1]CAF4521022.1 unnamed protein product [Rotaria sp. Silwood1]